MYLIGVMIIPFILALALTVYLKRNWQTLLYALSWGSWPVIFYGIRQLGSWFGGADIGFGLLILYSPILTVPFVFMSFYISRNWSDLKKKWISFIMQGIWISLSFAYNHSIYLAEQEYKRKSKVDCSVLPFHCAVQNQDQLLMEELKQKGISLELRDGFGRTALIRGIYDLDTVKKLLDLGADPNAVSGDGSSPLFYALFLQNEPQFETAELLIQFGARLDEMTSIYGDPKKINLLNYAITQNRVAIVNFLLNKNANVKIRDDYGYDACERAKIYSFQTEILTQRCL